MKQTNKTKYDLKFTDIYGNTQRIVKNAEPLEDEEGLYDLIEGFVSLLKASGWCWIEDLNIVKSSDGKCKCGCSDTVKLEEDFLSGNILYERNGE